MNDQLAMALVTGAIGFFVATLGAVIAAAVNARAKVDEGLRAQRLDTYPSLWSLTGMLSQWPPTAITWTDVEKLHEDFRSWYYSTGGMFLSERARHLYGDAQQLMGRMLEHRLDVMGELVAPQDYESMRQTCSALRTALAQDLETRRARSVWNAWQRGRNYKSLRARNAARLAAAKRA